MNADNELYREFIEGSIEAFEELVIKHKDGLIYFIYKYVNDLHIAEDIAQDVFAYIFAFKEKFNFKNSFSTYIYTLGRNKGIDYVRKHSKVVSLNYYEENEGENLEELVCKDEEKRCVLQSLKKIKKDYELAILLVDFEEFSYEEAAKIMGKTTAQFKVLLYRGRQSLKKVLEREGCLDEVK